MSDAPVALATRDLPGSHGPEVDGAAAVAVVGEALQVDELGLVAVAEATGPAAIAGAAARMALEQLRVHLARNADVVDRFRRHPAEALRARLQEVLAEGLGQASREVYALGHRRRSVVAVDLDAVVVVGGEAALAHAGRGAVMLAHEGLLHRLTSQEQASKPLPRSLDEDLADPPTRHPVATEPLGVSPSPPPVEAMVVGLASGDRVLVLGASLAAHLAPAAARGVLDAEQPGHVLDELLVVAATPAERPRVAALAQVGASRADLRSQRRRLATLRSIELFRWCTDEELHALVGLARPRTCRAGELLLRQGQVNPTLFLLVSGRVGVNKDGQRIAETDRGSVFGEMSMLDEPRASATVEALTDVEVLTLDRDAFLHALKGDASMAVKVLWSMLLRMSANLRRTSQRLASTTASGGVEDPADTPTAMVSAHEDSEREER